MLLTHFLRGDGAEERLLYCKSSQMGFKGIHWRSQYGSPLSGDWDRLEAPKGKILWLELPALMGGTGDDTRIFNRDHVGHVWERKLAVNSVRSCLSTRDRKGKGSSARKDCRCGVRVRSWWRGGSWARANGFPGFCRWEVLWAQELFQESWRYLMRECRPCPSAGWRERARSHQFWSGKRFPSRPFSPLPPLSGPQSHLQPPPPWGRGRSGRGARGHWAEAGCAGPNRGRGRCWL